MDQSGIDHQSMILHRKSQTYSPRTSLHIPRKTSWGTSIPPPSVQQPVVEVAEQFAFDGINLNTNSDTSTASDAEDDLNPLDSIAALGLSFNADSPQASEPSMPERFSIDSHDSMSRSLKKIETHQNFNGWVKKIHKRATRARRASSCDLQDLTNSIGRPGQFLEDFETRHRKSASGSSYGFVSAIKSASISLASFSIAPRSRRAECFPRHSRAELSTKGSNSGQRFSEDSSYFPLSVVNDQAVTRRLLQRRRVIEEIISTEEGYIADVKFLTMVYVTLLASIPSVSSNFRASINRNLSEIVELHEEILGGLHTVVPHSEYTQAVPEASKPPPALKHQRWKSLDAVPESSKDSNLLHNIPGMVAEPMVAAEVAKVFGQKLNQFFIYEEYGAKYEIMIKDIATTHRSIPQWNTYQKGLETLASSLSSIDSQVGRSRKSLTIGDLLVKPIQRVCKYPLLFAELLKQTPVCDCPESYMVIENILIRFREVTARINRATDDPRVRSVMEKSWLLQDRLVLPNKSGLHSRAAIRALGHIRLCGVLHVSWQTINSVDGQYLICVLFQDFLLLASADKLEQVYVVEACIGLTELRVEDIDNGRGLQCHTAPFSWKLVFEFDHRLFETTMTACSAKEELEWRSRLNTHTVKDSLDTRDLSLHTVLSLDIKPLGTVFGKPGTIARRISVHRATTVGPVSALCQVIIRNTNASKEAPQPNSSSLMNRSQSLLMTNRVPILAPARSERIRLETLLSDVWTRDVLPFPGMSSRARSDHIVRASASSMMRKLSVASITQNFKRSTSTTTSPPTLGGNAGIPLMATPTGSPSKIQHDAQRSPESEMKDDCPKPVTVHEHREKGNSRPSAEDLPVWRTGSNDGSIGTVRRLATLRFKKSWIHEDHRPPSLRTSSANSPPPPVKGSSTLTLTMERRSEDKENQPQAPGGKPSKVDKGGKGSGRNRGVVVDGIRSFFR